jgi:RNA polymerase sigma-70 factor (ECF subfamily)
VLRADETAVARGASGTIYGAVAVAQASLVHRARQARPALVNGEIGVVIAPRGQLLMVLRPTIEDGRIVDIEVLANPDSLRQLEVGVLD